MPHTPRLALLLLWSAFLLTGLRAQQKEPTAVPPSAAATNPTPPSVSVHPVADDRAIEARLQRIYGATGWFTGTAVRVDQGVAFINGSADNDEHREWATRLARSTQDVVAVVNNLELAASPLWDLAPAWLEVRTLIEAVIRTAPLLLLSLVILLFGVLCAGGARWLATLLIARRVDSQLLRRVVSNAIALPVLVVGVYVALRVMGLTQLAATVIGGTGLIGLVLGIAFRDIAENFLASILISAQRPFRVGDLIEVNRHRGYVQQVTLRGTLLMTLEGNHVQVPNAIVYKNEILNFTANNNERQSFVVGIDYEVPIETAQRIALDVLKGHEAVLAKPEPMVLVEGLGDSSVNLKAYFWVDISQSSALRVKSALMRLVKRAFQQGSITMPDTAREILFPQGVPVRILEAATAATGPAQRSERGAAASDAQVVAAEGGLTSEAAEIEEQAAASRPLEVGANLIKD